MVSKGCDHSFLTLWSLTNQQHITLSHEVLSWSNTAFHSQVRLVKSKNMRWPFISWTLLLRDHFQPCSHSQQTAMLCGGRGGTAIDDWITGSKALFITKGCLNGLTGNPASAKSQSFLPLWRQVIFAMKYCTSIHSIQPLTLTFGRKVAYS